VSLQARITALAEAVGADIKAQAVVLAGLESATGAAPVSIYGPDTLYVQGSIELLITDYDSFTAYAVSATAGTASISGQTISYTAPASGGGAVTLTVVAGDYSRDVLLTVQPLTVAPPAITVPAESAEVAEQPIIQTSAFALIGTGSDTHAGSEYQVRLSSGSWASPLYMSGTVTDLTQFTVPAGVIQQGGISYTIRARHQGASLGWGEWSADRAVVSKLQFAQVFGVALLATGGNGGTWAYVDIDGAAISNPGTTAFSAHPVWGAIADVTIDGQAMVKVPAFYIRRAIIASGIYAGKEAWWISDVPLSGFRLYSAFRNAGADVDQFWVGKYQASMQGTKLASVSGVLPAVSRSLTQFIADAAARNVSGVTGFMLWPAYHWSAIQWLYLVENATMDCQTKTGEGRVNASSAALVDAADVAQATYRGIVGLWGNVWQWMDGLKTINGVINLWDQNGNKSWVPTKSRTAATGNVYPTSFMDGQGGGWDLEDVFIGDTGPASNSDATAPDRQYLTNSGEVFPVVGGSWGIAAGAGLWCAGVDVAASSSIAYIGARLANE